jgi:hypothetical protein
MKDRKTNDITSRRDSRNQKLDIIQELTETQKPNGRNDDRVMDDTGRTGATSFTQFKVKDYNQPPSTRNLISKREDR